MTWFRAAKGRHSRDMVVTAVLPQIPVSRTDVFPAVSPADVRLLAYPSAPAGSRPAWIPPRYAPRPSITLSGGTGVLCRGSGWTTRPLRNADLPYPPPGAGPGEWTRAMRRLDKATGTEGTGSDPAEWPPATPPGPPRPAPETPRHTPAGPRLALERGNR